MHFTNFVIPNNSLIVNDKSFNYNYIREERGSVMLKKIKFILVFISLSICLGLMSTTYSRYVAAANGNVDTLFARWQILINDNDITNGTSSTINFQPEIDANPNVADNKVAPSSTGHFDIEVNPSNVDVSFKYDIQLGIENTEMPDLMITKYAVLPENYIVGDPVEFVNLVDGKITNTLNYDNNTENFAFKPFTIRVFFEWYDGVDNLMDDASDSSAGNDAAVNGTTFKMNATINFEQII